MDSFIFCVFCMVFGISAGGMIFEEQFDGSSLNTNNWNVEVTPNPHNDELQYYTDRTDNVYVENGHLVIKPIKENYGGRKYTSGRITSKFAWKFGRAEIRAKLPNGYGLWPAIWMMPKDSVYGGWPRSGEIDICEARGEHIDQIQSTIHYGDIPCCDNHYYDNSGDLKINGRIDEYHVYSVDWTPTALVYSLDGVPYFTQSLDKHIGWMYDRKGMPFDQEFYLILNIAVGGHYVNDPSPTTNWNYPDAEMLVDYFRVYPLEDISTEQCAVTYDATYDDVCGNVMWVCYNQVYADVSAECTASLINCCNNNNCELYDVKTMATNVYNAYDSQVNDASSCDFGGTASKQHILQRGYTPQPQCYIRDSATPDGICNGLLWACGSDNQYADVSAECNDANNLGLQGCCSWDPYSCNQDDLRSGSEAVFQAYYAAIPAQQSCDFGGVCYLSGIQQPIHAVNGYGA